MAEIDLGRVPSVFLSLRNKLSKTVEINHLDAHVDAYSLPRELSGGWSKDAASDLPAKVSSGCSRVMALAINRTKELTYS